jgi:hypothetical protein
MGHASDQGFMPDPVTAPQKQISSVQGVARHQVPQSTGSPPPQPRKPQAKEERQQAGGTQDQPKSGPQQAEKEDSVPLFDEDEFWSTYEAQSETKGDYYNSVDDWNRESQDWLPMLGVKMEVALPSHPSFSPALSLIASSYFDLGEYNFQSFPSSLKFFR